MIFETTALTTFRFVNSVAITINDIAFRVGFKHFWLKIIKVKVTR